MKPYRLVVITPEKTFFDGETTQITVRTTEGDIGILADHISLVAALPAGPMKIMQDNEFRLAAISSGLIKVGGNHVNIFADAVEWAEDIDIDWAKRSEEDALRRKEHSKNAHDMERAELKLQRALNRLRVSSMKQ